MQVALSGHYGYRRLLVTMLPVIGMMLICSVYSIVDGFFVSNFAGSVPFAAMNIIWPGLCIVPAVGLMLGTGGSALVSKTLGEGNPQKARNIFSMIILVCLIIGMSGSLLGWIFIEDIATLFGADDQLLPDAVLYGRCLLPALPFFLISMAFQPFYMAAEKPQTGTLMSVLSGVINVLLDFLFVVVFGWGLAGAAVATSISLIFGGAFPLVYFHGRKSTLYYVKVSFDGKALLKSATNGLSEFVGNIALNIVSICYNVQLMRYLGSDGVAAYGIIMYIGFIFGSIYIGYNTGVSQVIAYNYGAKNHGELSSLLHKSTVLIACAGLMMTLASEVSAPWLSKCFVGYDGNLCDITVNAIRIYMLSFLLCGFNMFASAWFTALNNGVVSAVAAFTRTLVFELACIFILPELFGTDGIWASVLVAETLAFILSLILVIAFRKRYSYVLPFVGRLIR